MGVLKRTVFGPFSSGSGASHGTGVFTTSAFTPPDNSLLVVIVGEIPTTDDASTGSSITLADTTGLTWTNQGSTARMPSWSGGGAVFTAPVGVAASMQLQVDCGAVNVDGYIVFVAALENYRRNDPVDQVITGTDADGDAAATITYPGVPEFRSWHLAAAFMVLNADANIGVTPGVDWGELGEVDLSPRFIWGQWQERNKYQETAVSWVDLDTVGTVATGAVLLGIAINAETEPPSASATPAQIVADEHSGSDGFVMPRIFGPIDWY